MKHEFENYDQELFEIRNEALRLTKAKKLLSDQEEELRLRCQRLPDNLKLKVFRNSRTLTRINQPVKQ